MENEKRRVLIVEDEPTIAGPLAYNLGRNGYDTDWAEDGEMGLRKALTENYDIILLDIMLPKLDGFKVLEGIRTRSDVPVIMVTASMPCTARSLNTPPCLPFSKYQDGRRPYCKGCCPPKYTL